MNLYELILRVAVFQHEPVRADQEEQLPGFHDSAYTTFRLLAATMSEGSAARENHSL